MTILRIESAGPDGRARRICFEDGSIRQTSAAAVKELGLESGALDDLPAVDAALAEVEPQFARNRALQLLGYRERSAKELTTRLFDNGYPASVVAPIVARYQEVELVDDARFATAWVRSRCSAGYGRRRIARELAEKGISDDLAQAALDEELADDELIRARDALRGRVPRDAKERDRLVRRLVARGFEFRTALDAVGDVAAEDDA